MKARQALGLIRSMLSGSGFISVDDRFPPRRLLTQLKTTLAVLKHRNIAAKKEFAAVDFYTLRCVELHPVDRVDYPTIPPSGLTWQKSVEPLPKFIYLKGVTDLLGQKSITIQQWDTLTSHSNARYKVVSESPIAAIRSLGDKLYLYVMKSNLEAVAVTMVPEDYAEAVLFPECGKVDQKLKCNPLDIEIGASDNLVKEAAQFILSEELKTNLSARPDIKNNANNLM